MADKVATQIRIDERVYELVKAIAEREMRSINAQMEYFIRQGALDYDRSLNILGLSPDEDWRRLV